MQGVPRRVLLAFPEDRPADLPVLVVWHGLGQSPERMFDQMALAAFAEDQRMVTVAPGSAVTAGPTWDIWATDGGADAVLYDDLRIASPTSSPSTSTGSRPPGSASAPGGRSGSPRTARTRCPRCT